MLYLVAVVMSLGIMGFAVVHGGTSTEIFMLMIGLFVFFGIIFIVNGRKIKFNDDGIILKSKLIQWSEIFCVDTSANFSFYYYTEKGHKNFVLSNELDNYEEILEYAVKKLPSDVFTEDAQKALKAFRRLE